MHPASHRISKPTTPKRFNSVNHSLYTYRLYRACVPPCLALGNVCVSGPNPNIMDIIDNQPSHAIPLILSNHYVQTFDQIKDHIEVWDLVLFKNMEDKEGYSSSVSQSLGRVLKPIEETNSQEQHSKKYVIELLERENENEFVATGIEVHLADLQAITQVIKDYGYEQRQEDRVHNPHGEHAKEVFTIPKIYLI